MVCGDQRKRRGLGGTAAAGELSCGSAWVGGYGADVVEQVVSVIVVVSLWSWAERESCNRRAHKKYEDR
eukprot:COSAG05_NODE_10548_length_559_cov_1.993478_1_plen_69_part_00